MDVVTVSKLFGIGILLVQANLLIIILGYIFDRDGWIIQFVKKHALPLVTLSGFFAVAGSLTLSDVLLFDPCKLCWFQRIFLYPTFFIGIVALITKDLKNALRYILVLAGIGVLISLYHYYIQISGSTAIPCSVSGQGPSCGGTYVKEFGYITIPMMALTLGLYSVVVSWIKLKALKS